ncbi:GFA family protein [Maricaulis sp.]|uniref:GFA family protein n=1 Tax=Maricaulis sp. TaxID=1486257 RepID=UPI0032986092|tara:strand:- start:122 stop:583 length:462 start_codon:yes stop_codon:yes gene_type:complete
MKLPLRGGCQCGEVRYEVTKQPLTLYTCHCTTCQQQSSSAFGMSMLVERDGFRFLKGEVAAFTIPTESKSNKLGLFCGKCGTRIANDTEGRPALSLKAGTLDDRAKLRPVGHIWTRSAQGWMTFDENALTYDKAPDDSYYALMERWAAQEHAS